MTDAFMNRWTTSDGSEHGDWVIKWFEYAKRQKVPSLVEMYTDRLKHIPVTELEAVCRTLQNPDYTQPVLPGIEAILKAHRERKKRQMERIDDAKKLRKKPTESEREAAKRATNAAFANRLMRCMEFVIPMTPPSYTGQFDYQSVAHAAPLPDPDRLPTNGDVNCLTYYWNECHRIFNEQWEQYSAIN